MKMGFWSGGDRDGNPFVTHVVTALAVRLQARTVLREYVHRLEDLSHLLTHSSSLVRPSLAFAERLAADAPLLLDAQRVRVRFERAGGGWFRRHHVEAVRSATLQLRRGETLGIVGESGSGKTTLGMALLALQDMAGGEVRLDGQRIDNADRAALRSMRRRMQVVFQDPFAALSPRMTVGQIVGEGLGLHRPELSADERRRIRKRKARRVTSRSP